MSDLFARIVSGDAPARVVWADRWCVAVLAKKWVRPGHTLVIARDPVPDWTAAPRDLRLHLLDAADLVAAGLRRMGDPVRVGVSFTGLTFDHLHAHVVPLHDHGDLDLADLVEPDPLEADRVHRRLRDAVRLEHAASLLLAGPRAA